MGSVRYPRTVRFPDRMSTVATIPGRISAASPSASVSVPTVRISTTKARSSRSGRVTASAPTRPDAILEQLKDGGIAVAPVDRETKQILVRYERQGDEITETDLLEVRFVPLVKGEARAL